MWKKRITILILFLLIDSCILFQLNHKNKPDPVDIEQRILTSEYGKIAFNILDDYVKKWDAKEIKVTGVRVLSYAEDSPLLIIGCTEEIFDSDNSNTSEPPITHWFQRIYAFEKDNDNWNLITIFFLDCDLQICYWESTIRDWWFLNEEEKAIIGELPEEKYWECLYPPSE